LQEFDCVSKSGRKTLKEFQNILNYQQLLVLFNLETADKIIFECVDTALSQNKFLNKEDFYRLLESSYGIEPDSIGSNYEVFHKALNDLLGINHYQVERAILRIMTQRTKDGVYTQSDEITAFSTTTTVYMKETEANILRVREITNLKKYTKVLEEKVKEADDKMKSVERLLAIGETAAMVGHDIRNPLQALTGDLYLLNEDLKDIPDGEKKQSMQESIGSMQGNVAYISKIVQDLQDFARPLNPEWQEVDMKEFFVDFLTVVFVPEIIKLKVDVRADEKVKTDLMFLRRALTNLVTNAIQAMPQGGKLTLKAHIDKSSLWISVSDTGQGIPEEVRERMFKPLVTAKSKGQGLGLAVVKRLVVALNGKISYKSEIGKGTEFLIELPINT